MSLTNAQWTERQRGLGGSDAAAALGLSQWVTPRELYDAKTADAPERVDPDEGPMLWGHLLEPLIRQRYADRTGRAVRVPDTLWSEQYPFMLAHLDGVTDCGRGFEAKTARTADGWGEPGSDQIPQPYLLQVQHCMIVARLAVFDVCVLIGGSEERMYEIPADPELQQLIVEGEADFWNCVQQRRPPEIDLDGPRALQVLRKVYPGTNGKTMTANDEHERWRIVMEEAQEFAATYSKVADGAKAHLLGAMGEAAFLNFGDGKALRRQVATRKGYAVEACSYLDARIVKAKE